MYEKLMINYSFKKLLCNRYSLTRLFGFILSISNNKKLHKENFILKFIIISVIATTLQINSFSQTTVTLQSTADVELYGAEPAKNYGVCMPAWVGPQSRYLIRFDLSSIPSTATILSATLTTTKVNPTTDSELIEARMVTNAWSEGNGDCIGNSSQATWNSRMSGTPWSTAGGDFNSTIYSTTMVSPIVQRYEWDIRNMVQAWVNGSSPNHGLMLKKVNESNSTNHEFATRESSSSSNRPALKITYVTNTWQGPVIHTIDQRIASGSGNNVSIERPANVVAGNLILLVFSHQRSPAATGSSFATPSGFTLIRSEHDASNNNRTEVVAFYKIAGASEPANYTTTVTTYTNTPNWKAYAVRVTGFDPSYPVNFYTSGSNSGTNAVTSGSIGSQLALLNNSVLFNAFTVRASTSNTTGPNEMSYISYQNGTGADASTDHPSLSVYARYLTNNINPGTHAYSWSGAGKSSGLSFYINPAPPSDCGGESNVVVNNEFNNSTNNWDFYVMNGAAATLAVDNTSQLSGVNSARVNVTTSFGTEWHVQLTQTNRELIAGRTYRFRFMARASSNRTITPSIDLGVDPWTNYFVTVINLTTTPQTFDFVFTQPVTTNLGRVMFNLASTTGTVWIDKVEFYEVCPCTPPSAPTIGTITQPTCQNPTGSVVLNGLPSSGSWTITRTPNGQTYSGSGSSYTVTGLEVGNYTFTVTRNNTCTSPSSANVSIATTCCQGPVNSNIIAKYDFTQGSGNTVNDVSGFGSPLNLTIQNPSNVSWVPLCGLRINSGTRISSGSNATKIRTALQATNAMTVEAWVQANNTSQGGPARIVSMSSDAYTRNFTMGQEAGTWIQRTRHSGGDTQGLPERVTTSGSATTNLTHLVFTRDASGIERYYINGVQNSTWTLAGNFSNWTDFVLHLANEQTDDRPWLGTLYSVAIYDQALSQSQVTQNFTAGSRGICANCPSPNCANPPSAPSLGTITQPTCSVPTGSVILNGLPSSGSWTIVRTPGNVSYTGTGTSFTVTGLPPGATYTFAVINSSNCVSAQSSNVTINNAPTPALGGATSVCRSATAQVTPSTGGTWSSSNTSVATVTNAGVVTGVSGGTVTLTYVRTSDGCSNTMQFTVDPLQTVGDPAFNNGASSTRCQGNATVTYTVTAANNTGLTYSLDQTSLNGGVTINAATGAVSYPATWTGTSVITVSASGCGGPKTANHTVTTNPTVQVPVFSGGTFIQRCQGAGTNTYTATAQNSTGLSYSLDATSLAGGNTINSTTGMVTWASGWVGISQITATASGCNGPVSATISIDSRSIFANDDYATGLQGRPLVIKVSDNDLCNVNPSSVIIVSPPQTGNVQMGTGGNVTYLPAGNFAGNDQFVYQICSTTDPGQCAQATVYVTINETFLDPCAEATRNKTYYLPFEENSTLRNALLSCGNVNLHSNIVRSVVSIKIPYPGIKITYDHWEDGYESNILSPVQSTTQIWGDGILTNGVAPGYPNDILPPGAYIILDNQFQYNPRVISTIAFDGRDKIFTTGDVAISKVTGDAGFGGGSVIFDVQNLKTNVYDVTRYGEYFVIPFGENISLGGTVAFRYTGTSIKAAQNGTIVNLDYNGDGIIDVTQTLNEGQFMYYAGTASIPGVFPNDVNTANDIKAGAVITANKPVGVDMIFGDGFNYGTRNLALLPSIFNANVYFSPVYTTTPTNANVQLNSPVYVFFNNVLDNPLTIQWSSKTSSGTVSVPANGTNFLEIPYTASPTGYRFASQGGEPFGAVAIIDADADGSRYDWTFNLIPEERLTTFSSIAWAPGSRDGTGNYNPIWVTPTANTTLYVKFDGNLTGSSSTMSPCGIPYDIAVPLQYLDSYRLYDLNDNDQSGTAIYTCDGVKFTAVWGQDSHSNGVASPPGSPAMDVGYVLEPKCLDALIFANDDSRFTLPNTPVTIQVWDNDFAFLCNLNPQSVSLAGLMQPMNGTTTLNPNGNVTYTPNPGFEGVDQFEYSICSIQYPDLCDIALVTIRVTDCPASETTNALLGTVFIEQIPDDGIFNGESGIGNIKVDLYLDANCNGILESGEGLVQSTISGPDGKYVFNVINGFNAMDNFEPSPSFSNNSGGINWSTSWIEQNDDSNLNTGFVRIMRDNSTGVLGNAIRLSGNASATLRGISRSLTFNNATAATLRFKYRREGLNNQGEELQVLINGTQVLAIDDGDYVGTDINYIQVVHNLSSFNANGSNVILFRLNSTANVDDFYWIDDVELIYYKHPICFITRIDPSYSGGNFIASSLQQRTATFSGLNTCVKNLHLGVLAQLIATDDLATTAVNTAVNIPVLQNDVIGRINVSSLTTSGVSNNPANGTVVINTDGTITYTPNPGFSGTDDFEYRVCSQDDPNVCDIALVTVTVNCINIPKKNAITGKVYFDNNLNGEFNSGETVLENVTAELYRDFNGNGVIDAGDVLLDTKITNAAGDYQFVIDPPVTNHTYRDNFNTNGSGNGSNGTTNWTSPWTEINETNGFGVANIWVTNNTLRLQGENLFYLDQFNANTTANQSNGTVDWSGQSWVEIGESNGFATNQISITSANGLRISGSAGTTVLGARRMVPLSVAGAATLSFTARASGLDDGFDFVDVQVASSDAGPWTTLTRIIGPAADVTNNFTLNIPNDLLSSTTTIRFVSSGFSQMATNDIVFFDNVRITYIPTLLFKGAARTANLSNALTATLSLDFEESGLDLSTMDYVDLQIAQTPAGPWTLLRRFTGADGNQSGNYSVDITDFISSSTTIRFLTSPSTQFTSSNIVNFDNVQISYQLPAPANYIVKIQTLPSFTSLASPAPPGTYSISFTGAGEGVCTRNFGLARADLSIVKSASKDTVFTGQNLNYTISVTNQGPTRATNVTVNDVMPNGYTFSSATPSAGTWSNPTWTIGNLNVGQTVTLTIQGSVSTTRCQNFTNSAFVSSSVPDPNTANNASNAGVVVLDNIPPVIDSCARARVLNICDPSNIDQPSFSAFWNQTTFNLFNNSVNYGQVSDNCGLLKVEYRDSISGSCPTIVTRKWLITDTSDNSSECTQNISLQDTIPPSLNGSVQNIYVNGCNLSALPPPATDNEMLEELNIEVEDNCTTASQFTVSSVDQVIGSCPITINRTYTIRDKCNNALNFVQQIFIQDTIAPVIQAPDTTILLGCNPSLPIAATVENLINVTDNCYVSQVNITPGSITGSCDKQQIFQILAMDSCGNQSVKTVTFQWKSDTVAPLLSVPETGLFLGTNPQIVPSKDSVLLLSSATDSCGIFSLIVQDGIVTGTCEKSKTYQVIATDSCGNQSMRFVTYTWLDSLYFPEIQKDTAICVDSAFPLYSADTGTWTSSNPGIASISSGNILSANLMGAVTLTFTRTSDNCTGQTEVIIRHRPLEPVIDSLRHPDCYDPTGTAYLSGLPMGDWTIQIINTGNNLNGNNSSQNFYGRSGDRSGARGDVGMTYTLTGLTPGQSYRLIVFNEYLCPSDTSAEFTINPLPANPELHGDTLICEGTFGKVYPDTAGIWTSNNNLIATVNNSGNVFAVSSGTVYLTYMRLSDGCKDSISVEVLARPDIPAVSILQQPTCYVQVGKVLISNLPSGAWTLTRNPDNFQYTGTGNSIEIDSLPKNTTYTFTVENSDGCISNYSSEIEILGFPEPPILGGDTFACFGLTAKVTPTKAGSWTSSDNNIAQVTNDGSVTGISAGQVTLTYTRLLDGCQTSMDFVVRPEPNAPYVLDIIDPTCANPTGSVTLGGFPEFGNWYVKVYPGDMIYQGSGQIFTVDNLPMNQTYFFNFEDVDRCISETSEPASVGGLPASPAVYGDSIVCIGDSIRVFPDFGGNWTSPDSDIAIVNDNGWVTGTGAGNVYIKYTRTLDGCDSTKLITVLPLPQTLVLDSIRVPTCIQRDADITLTNLPQGLWKVIQQPGDSIFSGSGQSLFIQGLLPGQDYFYTVLDSNECKSSLPLHIQVPDIPQNPVLSGADEICLGSQTTLLPSSGGQWVSSNPLTASITDGGVVTGSAIGQVTLTYTRDSDGCENTKTLDVRPVPVAQISGADQICFNTSTALTASGGISYQWSTNATTAAIMANSTGWYKVKVTNSFGCEDSTSHYLSVNPLLSVNINYHGSVCLTEDKTISADVSGGSGIYSYSWTGPDNFISQTDTILLSKNGNYYLTVTDHIGCMATTSAFIYDTYSPFISSIQTTICEGDSIQLTVNSASAVSYQWSANAQNSTASSVVVYPQLPFSEYFVTVTNDLGCASIPSLKINVNPRPEITVSGRDTLCTGDTTALYPSSGGSWISLNPAIASISASGVVTGLSGGLAKFRFTLASTGCSSIDGAEVRVFERPGVQLTGPAHICEGTITAISPSSGGTWTSNNPSIATINSEGIITGLSGGITSFVFTSDTTGCTSLPSASVTVSDKAGVTLSGPTGVCIGSSIQLIPSHSGGTWQSNNSDIATVNTSGIVTAISQGSVIITYTYQSGPCIESDSKAVIVHPIIGTSITGPVEICPGETTQLSPTSGGTWSSSNPEIASVNNQGLVTAITAGNAQFIFTSDAGCQSLPTGQITVKSRPGISLQGADTICINSFTTFLPASGGTWISHNPLVASINNSGVVQGLSPGNAKFSFVSNASSCVSDTSTTVTVSALPSLGIDYHGSVCLTDTSKLSVLISGGLPAYNITWSGPSGFTANTQTININTNGNYSVTVTDRIGCSANISGFVFQRFESTVINFNSTVCEGTQVNLSVNASGATGYLWSPNAGSATTSTVTVTPGVPSSTYQVTVTNSQGCAAVAQATINVLPKPAISLNGPANICVGQTTQLLPSSGGLWSSLNPGIATINNAGFITGISPGTARFLYISNATGCVSDTSVAIVVQTTLTLGYNGPSAICIGSTTQLTPVGGGVWTSNHPTIASVTNEGLVTAISAGTATFNYNSSAGCVNNGPIQVVVHPKPGIALNGPASICPGSTTNFLPSTGGSWLSLNPSVASITNSGQVTGQSPGNARFIFTNSSTGCKSDTSGTITVLSRPEIQITGNTTICVGATTTLNPTTGGVWTSNQPTIASVTNSGIVTGLNPGMATFVFTSSTSGCSSIASGQIIVNPRPAISFSGPSSVCVGATSQLSPSSGGTWTSTNPAVASVNNSGQITALTPGITQFIFTSSATGCISQPSGQFTVNSIPEVSIMGSPDICIGSTTTLSPSTGGSWISSNPSIASVNNNGVVTGIAVGSAHFIFQETATGCTSNPTGIVNVVNKPAVSISGPATICVGQTTQLQPSSGGIWTSLNPSVASVNNNGLVTGLTNGLARFTYTNAIGCTSDPTGWIVINAKPQTILTVSELCVGSTTQALPSMNGIWTSANSDIASISPNGLITGISTGFARFIFQDTITGCISDTSSTIFINPLPVLEVNGPNTVCVGQTAQLTPTAGGNWTSINPSLASITNSGLISAVAPGKASFRFVHTATGCASEIFEAVTIIGSPQVSVTGDASLCIGEQSSMGPSSGGTWISLNPSVATITASGIITAVNPGTASFRFTQASSGCTATANSAIVVNPKPNTNLNGPDMLCIGGQTNLTPSSGGIWTSSKPQVASITNNGIVSGLSAGTARFVFTDTITGCISDSSVLIQITNPINLSITGSQTICVGYNTLLSAPSQGVWFSTDPRIATVTTQGTVTGIAPGKVSFYFIESNTGCTSYLEPDAIHVINCTDPDFNVTFVNKPVTGNVATNDDIPGTASYGTPVLLSKPEQGSQVITMNSNGSYTFTANYPGKYTYNVPVCIAPVTTGCPSRILEINVVQLNNNQTLVANPEIITVYEKGSSAGPDTFVLNTQSNDACVSRTGCNISGAALHSLNYEKKGVLNLSSNMFGYTPNINMAGRDTIKYYTGNTLGTSVETHKSSVYITINAHNALNSTVASDDFFAGAKGQTISGNVLLNDSDPEGDMISVIPQGTAQNPVVLSSGSYYLTANGNFVFTPNASFSGPTEFVYEICDNNAQQFCTKATVHILLADELQLRIRAYLEGALMNTGNQNAPDGRPLMRDNLRQSPYTGLNYIPTLSPYLHPTEYTDITYRYQQIATAEYSKFDTLHNASAVFAVTGQNAIVDWVFVELRNKNDLSQIIGSRSCLIQRDGDIVDIDGISPVSFPGIDTDSLYVVVRHRNHLAVMSQKVSVNDLLDFTKPNTPVYNFRTSLNNGLDYAGLAQNNNIRIGWRCMWAGDFDADGKVKFVNPNDDQNILFFEVLIHPNNTLAASNFNFAFGYYQGDYNMDAKVKYDNPDDDKNLLYSQILLYPLNTSFLANFDSLIEQVPAGNISR